MKFLFIGLFVLSFFSLSAHEGGHGHDKSSDRVWAFDEGKHLEGSLLLIKEGKAFIETEYQIVPIEIASLSLQDQKYIDQKMEEIHHLNEAAYEPALGIQNKMGVLIISLSFVFAVFVIFVLGKRRKLHPIAHITVWIIIFSAPFIFLTSCNEEDEEAVIVETPDGEVVTTAISDPEKVDLAFAPYTATVDTRWDNSYFYVESQGIPEHQMMVGITAWIAQVPTLHDYTGDNAWDIPLKPQYSDDPVSITDNLRRGAVAIATNGIPIFNPINASGLVSKDLGELDEFGGHSGRGDDYHYHTAPLHLSTIASLPIAYAFDGYAIYGSTEPDGGTMESLDEFHGHTDDEGLFHYHGTDSYPFIFEKMRGVVALSGNAPETQIEPQPVASAFRGDPHGINSDNLIITDLVANGAGNGYELFYTSNGSNGSVNYSWDENDLYTFVFNDINGQVTTETFQR